ncbi:hypothetical protein D3C72_446310 [compost metagenome]
MAVGVVELLEVIDVHHEQAELAAVATDALHLLLEAHVEEAPHVEPRQPVHRREVIEPGVLHGQRRHVGDGGEQLQLFFERRGRPGARVDVQDADEPALAHERHAQHRAQLEVDDRHARGELVVGARVEDVDGLLGLEHLLAHRARQLARRRRRQGAVLVAAAAEGQRLAVGQEQDGPLGLGELDGHLGDRIQHLVQLQRARDGAVEPVEHLELAAALLLRAHEPRVDDGLGRQAGEGLHRLEVRAGEAVGELLAIDVDGAQHLGLILERHADDGLKIQPQDAGLLAEARVREGVHHADRLAGLEHGARHRAAVLLGVAVVLEAGGRGVAGPRQVAGLFEQQEAALGAGHLDDERERPIDHQLHVQRRVDRLGEADHLVEPAAGVKRVGRVDGAGFHPGEAFFEPGGQLAQLGHRRGHGRARRGLGLVAEGLAAEGGQVAARVGAERRGHGRHELAGPLEGGLAGLGRAQPRGEREGADELVALGALFEELHGRGGQRRAVLAMGIGQLGFEHEQLGFLAGGVELGEQVARHGQGLVGGRSLAHGQSGAGAEQVGAQAHARMHRVGMRPDEGLDVVGRAGLQSDLGF